MLFTKVMKTAETETFIAKKNPSSFSDYIREDATA